MRWPKRMNKGNTTSDHNSKVNSLGFKAKLSETMGAEQSLQTTWTSKHGQMKLNLGQEEDDTMWRCMQKMSSNGFTI